jgi:pimeloyl-ACP methyl ester carboxylesterase
LPWGCIKAQIYGRPSANSKPILALHGFLDNSNSFKPLGNELTKLKPDYFIIALDLPGHGFSSHINSGIPYTPKLLVSSLRRVVKYFGLNNFILLSHSYGCFLSILVSYFLNLF